MKFISILFSSLLITFSGFSQEVEEEGDTTTIKLKKIKIIITDNGNEEDPDQKINVVLDTDSFQNNDDEEPSEDGFASIYPFLKFGVNGYLHNGVNADLPASASLLALDYSKSQEFGWGFRMRGVQFWKNHLYLSPGLQFTYNNYRLAPDAFMFNWPTNDSTVILQDSNATFNKTKLRVTMMEIPLIFRINFGDKNDPDDAGFKLHAGVIGGYNIGSLFKRKFSRDGNNVKSKAKDDFNIEPFRVSGLVEVGYNNWALYGTYSLTELFQANQLTPLNPFTVGIRWGR